MKLGATATVLALLLTGCVDEPSPKEAEKAAAAIEKDAERDAVKERKLSIEEAAEEATKLIEADAKAEANEAVAERPSNNPE
jgi:predicted  nucleic acid-binding Zn-ribbon protein